MLELLVSGGVLPSRHLNPQHHRLQSDRNGAQRPPAKPMSAQLLLVRRQRLNLGLELAGDPPTLVTGAQVTVITEAKSR